MPEQTESGNSQPFYTTYSGAGVTKRLKREAEKSIEAAIQDMQSALELVREDRPESAVSRVVAGRAEAEDARHALRALSLCHQRREVINDAMLSMEAVER